MHRYKPWSSVWCGVGSGCRYSAIIFCNSFRKILLNISNCHFVSHLTAPGQRDGDYSGFSLRQRIHPWVAGCLAEAGGWGCHRSGPQVPLSSLFSSPFFVPNAFLLHMGTGVWPWEPSFCLIKYILFSDQKLILYLLHHLLFFFFFKDFLLFIYLFLAVLGLRFCARAFSSCGERGPLFIAVRGPLTVVASLVAEHRLQMHRLSSCGSRA